jgi:hypothetical protein
MDGEAVDVRGPWAGPAMQGEAEGSAMGRRGNGRRGLNVLGRWVRF